MSDDKYIIQHARKPIWVQSYYDLGPKGISWSLCELESQACTWDRAPEAMFVANILAKKHDNEFCVHRLTTVTEIVFAAVP